MSVVSGTHVLRMMQMKRSNMETRINNSTLYSITIQTDKRKPVTEHQISIKYFVGVFVTTSTII